MQEKENDHARNDENVSRTETKEGENNKETTEESIKSSLFNVKKDAKNEESLTKNTKAMTSQQDKNDGVKLVPVTSEEYVDGFGDVATDRRVEGELISTSSINKNAAQEEYSATGQTKDENYDKEKDTIIKLVHVTENYDSLENVDTNQKVEGGLLSTYSENNNPPKKNYYATGELENESFENEKVNMVKIVPLDYDDYDADIEFEAISEREEIEKNHTDTDNAPSNENSMNNHDYYKTHEEHSATHNQETIYMEDDFGTADLYPEEKDPYQIIEDNKQESRHSHDDALDEFGGFGNDENYAKNLPENDDIEEAIFIRSEFESSHMALKSSNNVENEAELSPNMLYTVSSERIISVEPSLLLITVLVFMNTHLFISYRCQG